MNPQPRPVTPASNDVVPPVSIPLVPLTNAGAERFDLEQVRQILPYLVDALSDAVVVVDREQRVVAANRRYVEEFGIKSGWTLHGLCRDTLQCPENRAGAICGECASADVLHDGRPVRRIRSLPDAEWRAAALGGHVQPGGGRGRARHPRGPGVARHLRAQQAREPALAQRAPGLARHARGGRGARGQQPARLGARGRREPAALGPARATSAEQSLGEASEVLEVLEREARRCRETTDKLMLLAQPYSVGPAGWI